MELELLKDVIIIFGLSILVIYIFHLIKIPPIIGFLLTGILVGPHGFELIKATGEVELMAEFGVILLLFTIGIEFSFKNLLRIKRIVLLGGSLQVGLTIILSFLAVRYAGLAFSEALFVGFLVSLSSTAIVLKVLQDKGDLGAQHGQISLGILIFQDLIVVPMILITPVLAQGSIHLGGSILMIFVKGIGLLAFMYVSARWIVPWILFYVARTQSRELFMITIIALGFALAWLTSSIGLSLALGAFIGGLIISESEYSEQAFGNIVPFRDAFTSFFFVSVGMLFNIQFVIENIVLVLSITLGVLIIKTFISGLIAFLLGYPFRTTVIVGLTLSQIGEFSFILSEFGIEYNLLSPFNYQVFLAVTVLSISLTPFIISVAPKLADFVLRFNIPKKLRYGLRDFPEMEKEEIKDHLIIVGFGINGRNVAYAARYAEIPHLIIEMNPETVKEELAKGEIICYGDATQEEILKHANIQKARILILTIPIHADTKRIIIQARKLNPDIYIIIRTRFISDMKSLYQLGADQVIPEEFETSVQIFTRVLDKYGISHDKIEALTKKIRSDGYEMFRSFSLQKKEEENPEKY